MTDELPQVTEPLSAPTALQNLIEDYNARASQGEVFSSFLLLRDALGYFLRYYLGVCVAACRELDCLPGEVAQAWTGTPLVENAIPQLQLCLEHLLVSPERLARKLSQVFYEPGGARRPYTEQLWTEGRDFVLSDPEREPEWEEVVAMAHLLDAWVTASYVFFLECEHRLETGAYFGQLEQLVCFEQYSLRTGLTMRVFEGRRLVARPTAALAQPAGPPAETPEAPLEGMVGLQQLLAERKLAPSAPEQTSPAPKIQAEMEVRLEPLGFVRGAQGKIGYGGYIWIDSPEGEEIQGVVSATGGQVELTPGFFSGVTSRIAYWVSPDDVASAKEYVKIRGQSEERLYALWRLAPPSRFETFTRGQQSLLMLFPSGLGVLYASWILYSTLSRVEVQLHQSLGEEYSRYINTTTPLSLKQAGIGDLDVSIKPQIESALLIFLVLAWLVPVVNAKLYARLPRKDQRALVILFVLGSCFPSLFFVALYGSSFLQSDLTIHPELALLDFRRSLLPFVVVNGLTSLYVMFSVEGLFHRFLNDLGRFALAGLGTMLAFLVILVQVYGTSWFG